jgi:hypothetical protein
MTRTENQTTQWSGVARFATHTPIYTPPTTGGRSYEKGAPAAGPSHNRVAIIGATGVAVLLVVMGGIAFLRAQDATVPVAAPVAAPVVAMATVPHGAAAELAATLAMAPAQAVVVTAVPHAATAELADSLADVPVVVTTPVPHGAVPVE